MRCVLHVSTAIVSFNQRHGFIAFSLAWRGTVLLLCAVSTVIARARTMPMFVVSTTATPRRFSLPAPLDLT